MSALYAAIVTRAAQVPDRIAVDDGRERISYAALPARVATIADTLGRVLDGTAAPVGLARDNDIDWILADLALLSLGVACVPIPAFFTPAQAGAVLRDAGACAIIDARSIRRLDLARRAVPAGTAKISYTSGSTGAPKGICLPDTLMLATATAIVARFGADMAGTHLPLLPLAVLLENVAGLYASLLAGGTYAPRGAAAIGLAQPFRPDLPQMVAAIAATRATSLILVPELLGGIVAVLEASGRRLPALRLVAVGGARVPVALLDRAAALGLPVVQGYGLTECGSVVAIEALGERVRGTTGLPLGHVHVTLADDGEILVDGVGHLGTIDAPRPGGGPLATGDIGALDSAGRLTIVGRKSSMLVTGFGRNVAPEWVEDALRAQPGVAQACVYGDGDAALSAFIVASAAEADIAAAVAAANRSLPSYARIAGWRSVRAFTPADGTLTANGRLRRSAILHRETAMPFFDQLVDQTAAARAAMLRTPQLQAGLTGQIDRATYIAYLTQAYHHVSHTVPLMHEARMRLGHNPMLVAALDEYIAEETGHEAWILDDIAAAGGDRAAAIAAGPSDATAAMIAFAYDTIRHGNPAAFFGMVFVLEGTSIAFAQQGAEAVQASLGLPPAAFRYLTSHGALDQEHMVFFEGLMNRIDDPADRIAIVAMAKAMFGLFGGMFAAIPMEAIDVAA